MTLAQIVGALLALQPSAKFSVWEEEPPFAESEDPSTARNYRLGFIVCWHLTNVTPCPTEAEILAAT